MNPAAAAKDILDIMLRHLGFPAEIDVQEDPDAPSLNIHLPDPAALIGKNGERLDDLQHLVNKLLRQKLPDARRVRIDVEGFRNQREEKFLNEMRRLAGRVREKGEAVKLEPMNSYERRLVHTLFKNDPDVRSWSPEDTSRLKRITLLPRKSGPA